MGIGRAVRESIRILGIDRALRLLSKNSMVDSMIGRLVPENLQYKPGTIRYASRHGLKYALDISDYQGWLIYFGFLNDQPDGLSGLVKSRFNIMDVGANIGQTSMGLSRLISPDCMIWAFEPDPVNYRRMKENLALNAISNIKALNMGLGSHEHTASMMPRTAHNRGGNSVQMGGEENGNQASITTLDRFVAEHNCRVDLVKIDVEGYEMEVLKGAAQCLREQRPILFIELDDELLKTKHASPASLIAWLENMNYSIRRAGHQAPLTHQSDFNGCHFDVIAIPNQA